jgi:hypothetical protein
MGSAARATAYPTFTVEKDRGAMDVDATQPFYGVFHLAAHGNRPARVWLGVSDEQVERMAEKAADRVLDKVVDAVPQAEG